MEEQIQKETQQKLLLQERNQEMKKLNIKEAEEQRRKTMRMGLVTSFNMLGQGISTFLTSPTYLLKVVYLLGAYQMTKLAAAAVMARFGRPQLVRETSKIVTSNFFMVPWMLMKRSMHRQWRRKESQLLDGVIIEEKLEKQLQEISYAVLNRRKHFAPCKNMLFHGPPGTGKTSSAKLIASEVEIPLLYIGLQNVITKFVGESEKNISDIYELADQFDQAIIFIDEIDSVAQSRNKS